ncbi:phosphoribosyltransferase family protein [Paenibacillus sp. QZ-Y1]|uniref:phosphoribosyltransferase family protein n=1 Tax=Paenibacillus sp. QZ-Y1 TaxID=3414511 RepID=UPI003F7AC93F
MIKKYKWDTFQKDIGLIIQNLGNIEWDLIVGVARGGLPLAVSLSHGFKCKNFGVVVASKTNSEDAFDVNPTMRVLGEPSLPELKNVYNVLIVDDIVALGDGFSLVEKLHIHKYGDKINIRFVSLFADFDQIKQGEYSEIVSRMFSPNPIDNKLVWVEFPWEREGVSDA